MIGGNISLQLQINTTTVDEIGSRVQKWTPVQSLYGWLDYISGEAGRANYHTKIEESTHVFVCDFVELHEKIKAENCRAIVNGKTYDVVLIDNPMELNYHLEIYLKYTGGQNG